MVRTERLKKVILYIQNHYHRPIRLSELADLIPMSEGQFCRFFKSMTGQTPVDYMNSYRVRQVAELLRQPDNKISDIALDVGFGISVILFGSSVRSWTARLRSIGKIIISAGLVWSDCNLPEAAGFGIRTGPRCSHSRA